MTDVRCEKHGGPEGNEWKVAMEELTDPDDELCEVFVGQVCPLCFISVRDKYRQARRRLRTESRNCVTLRTKCDELQEVVDAVVDAVEKLTGQDPLELAKASTASPRGGLETVLPNLIMEAVNRGRKG